jgi:hypothetical protein
MSSFLQPGLACRRSRLPSWLRFAITFAVLFALKYAMPAVGVASAAQTFVLLVTATIFAWMFWWNCSPDRRGVFVLVSTLWLAGLVKLWRL